jgi:hypothetical protein
MLICNECGEVFEEPKIIEEHHPYGMTYATEHWAVCPHCEETDFQEARQCTQCGEYVADLEEGLCEICYDEMYG